eukprot:6793838-Pyramimonas_sp.AAC.1
MPCMAVLCAPPKPIAPTDSVLDLHGWTPSSLSRARRGALGRSWMLLRTLVRFRFGGLGGGSLETASSAGLAADAATSAAL